MTSRTTWKSRGIRAAVALAGVAVVALWLVLYTAATALAKEHLPDPWPNIVRYGLLGVVVFLCLYLPGTPRARGGHIPTTVYSHRSPGRRDREPRGSLWYEVDDNDILRAAWTQRGWQWWPLWRPFDTVFQPGASNFGGFVPRESIRHGKGNR